MTLPIARGLIVVTIAATFIVDALFGSPAAMWVMIVGTGGIVITK